MASRQIHRIARLSCRRYACISYSKGINHNHHLNILRSTATRTNFERNSGSGWLSTLPLAFAATTAAFVNAEAFQLDELEPTPLTRMESGTNVAFPVSLSNNEVLSGLGVRLMGGLVKVYAVGIYLDPKGVRTALADWHGFSVNEISSADPLWETLCSPAAKYTRTVRMVVVRQVEGHHMQHGFEKALLKRVATAAKRGRCSPSKCKKDALEFCSLFTTVGTMKNGSEIEIKVQGDIVNLVIDGRLIGQIRNAQLSWAVLDMFLGSRGVVAGLRNDVAKGLRTLLNE